MSGVLDQWDAAPGGNATQPQGVLDQWDNATPPKPTILQPVQKPHLTLVDDATNARDLLVGEAKDIGNTAFGGLEALSNWLTGTVGQVVGKGRSIAGSIAGEDYPTAMAQGQKWADALTDKPETPEGKKIAAIPGEILSNLPSWAQHPGDTLGANVNKKTGSPVLGTLASAVPMAAGAALPFVAKGLEESTGATGTSGKPSEWETPQNESPAPSPQSVGADATDIQSRLAVASPELQADAQAALREAQAKYGNNWQSHVDLNAMDRQLNADSLPVPGRLTKGQASGDGPTISEEWNKRSTNGLAPTFAAQNANQIDNLKAIRDQSTPYVYTNTPAEHADSLINSYKDLYSIDKKVVDDKWDAIRAQSGDKPIFDANQMLTDSQLALKKNLLSSQDPGGQLAELMDAARSRGGLSADGYNAFRQNLGQIAMKGGTEGKAAGIVINATNKSKILPEAAQFRDQINDALSSGRDLHQKLAGDPAYQSVVDGNASVKDFVNKYVINGKPENVAQMTQNLSGNDVARQTMGAAILDDLRTKAGLDDQYQGTFAAKSFNKQLGYITPNAKLVLNNGELETLRNLGDYSTQIATGGRDSWKNFSNTATELNTPTHAMASKVGGMAMKAGEAGLAHLTNGASIPLVGVLRSGMEQRAAIRAAIEEQDQAAQYLHDTTRPAAGFIK